MGGLRFCICGGVLALALFVCSRDAFSAATDIYSEQTYLRREDRVSLSLRVREELFSNEILRPHLTGGTELWNILEQQFSGVAGSHVFAGGGVGLHLRNAMLLTEVRARHFVVDVSQQPIADARVLLVYGDYWEHQARWLTAVPFAELYSELLLTSADQWNAIGAAFVRGGLRFSLGRTNTFDVFVEPFATRDRVGHFYNNRTEQRLNARLSFPMGAMGMSLTATLQGVHYFAFPTVDPNPYADRFWGARLLAVFWGRW